MRQKYGFSLIELLIAVAITGILLGVGAVTFRPGRNAVNQAANILSAAVSEARFEAIRSNRTTHFLVTTSGDGGYGICVDENEDGTCASSEVVKQVQFGIGDYAKVALTDTDLTSNRIRFDSRGISLDAIAGKYLTITERGGSYSKNVVLSGTGRTEVQ